MELEAFNPAFFIQSKKDLTTEDLQVIHDIYAEALTPNNVVKLALARNVSIAEVVIMGRRAMKELDAEIEANKRE